MASVVRRAAVLATFVFAGAPAGPVTAVTAEVFSDPICTAATQPMRGMVARVKSTGKALDEEVQPFLSRLIESYASCAADFRTNGNRNALDYSLVNLGRTAFSLGRIYLRADRASEARVMFERARTSAEDVISYRSSRVVSARDNNISNASDPGSGAPGNASNFREAAQKIREAASEAIHLIDKQQSAEAPRSPKPE